jgi:hypothetical protein
MPQNFKNHARYEPFYHIVLVVLVITVFISACINICVRLSHGDYSNSSFILFGMSVILLLLTWFVRSFPLKAQDRAIRAEENFRHYVLTGKLLDSRLTMSQIIALRFASDEEFAALAQEAAEKNIDSKSIKKSIANWREDNYRV